MFSEPLFFGVFRDFLLGVFLAFINFAWCFPNLYVLFVQAFMFLYVPCYLFVRLIFLIDLIIFGVLLFITMHVIPDELNNIFQS